MVRNLTLPVGGTRKNHNVCLRGLGVTEIRLSVPEVGKRLLPLPVAAWHATVGAQVLGEIAKGDRVLVHGQLVRRFYRSGAGARSLTEVVASGIKKLEPLDRAAS